MTDVLTRLKTFKAPADWEADKLIYDTVKYIEFLRGEVDKHVEWVRKISDEELANTTRMIRLERALKPFAEVARVFDPDMIGGTMPRTGEWQSWPRMVDGKYHVYMLTVEHLREARDAIKDSGQ